MLPPVAGVSEFWSLLLHLEEGVTEVENAILLDSPFLVSSIGPMLGHPDGHLFEFNYTDFLEQFRVSRKRLGLDDLVPYLMRHSGVSIELNSKCRSQQEAQKRGRWRQHLSMARYEKRSRLQATASRYSPRLFAYLRVARDYLVDATWNRAKIGLCSPFR